jgi:hypothetical protein
MSKPLVTGFLAALACGAMLTAPALAQTVSGVELRPLPTEMKINVVGKDYETVRADVRVAARTVCRNAHALGEVKSGDVGWCSAKSSYKTMRQYREALDTGALASADAAIVLSLR